MHELNGMKKYDKGEIYMGMSLQIRESLQELLYSDKYDTEDTEILVQNRFKKKSPTALNPRIENPLFREIERLMDAQLDHRAVRDYYFSSKSSEGCVLVYPFKDTEFFMALDLCRGSLQESDIVTLAVYCDARKFVKLKELFVLMQENSELDYKPSVLDAPLVKAVLEGNGKTIFYRGEKIPVASEELLESLRRRKDAPEFDDEDKYLFE